jgi:hypothetical protein
MEDTLQPMQVRLAKDARLLNQWAGHATVDLAQGDWVKAQKSLDMLRFAMDAIEDYVNQELQYRVEVSNAISELEDGVSGSAHPVPPLSDR